MGVLNSSPRYYALTYKELHSEHFVSDKLYTLLKQSGLLTVEDLFIEYESPNEFLTMADVLGLLYDTIELDMNIMIDSLHTNPTAISLPDRNIFAQVEWGNNLVNRPMLRHLTFKELARKKYMSKGLYERLVDRANLKSVGDYLLKYSTPESFRNDVTGVGAIYMIELVNLLNEMYKAPKKFMEIRKEKVWKKNGFSVNIGNPVWLSPSAAALRFDLLHSKNIIDHTLYYRLVSVDSLTCLGDFVQQFRSTENFQYLNGFIGPGTIKRLDILLDNIESIMIVNKINSFNIGAQLL